MNWIDRLDKKIGKYAPRHLIYFIVALYLMGFVLQFINPTWYGLYLCLDIEKVLSGQVWRIVTFLMYPSGSVLLFALTAYMYYWIGNALESEWGSFQFDLYYISGILLTILVTIVAYIITGVSYIVTPVYLNLSLFMAYAALFPDRTVLFFFILPLKAKWLALIDLVYFAIAILRGVMRLPILSSLQAGVFDTSTTYYYVSEALAAGASLIVFAIYYFSGKTGMRVSHKDKKRTQEFRRKVVIVNGAMHKCEVCGRTELTNPELEFRYCSKCNGIHEYCTEHLYTHEHR